MLVGVSIVLCVTCVYIIYKKKCSLHIFLLKNIYTKYLQIPVAVCT